MKLSSKKYFGKAVKSITLNNYHLSLTTYDKHSEVPFHCHKNPYLSLSLGIIYNEIGRHKEQTLYLGDVIIRPVGYEHKNIFNKSNGICFNVELVNNSNSTTESLFNNIEIKTSTLGLYKLYVAFVSNHRDDELSCLTAEAMISNHDEIGLVKKKDWYYKVIDQIQEEYDTSLTYESLSKTAHVHPNYLARKFKQINGLTMGDYIRNVRIEKGFIFLISGQSNLTEVALRAGFYDQSHFIKNCQIAFKLSPRKIRSSFKRLI